MHGTPGSLLSLALQTLQGAFAPELLLMPKQKSKGAVKKRFRISKNGKAVCSHPDRGHGHAPFSGETGRRLRRRMVLNKTWSELVRNMIGK